jgi:hypothetical protein
MHFYLNKLNISSVEGIFKNYDDLKTNAKEMHNHQQTRERREICIIFFTSLQMKILFVCIIYKINEEKLRNCIKGGPIIIVGQNTHYPYFLHFSNKSYIICIFMHAGV